MASICLETHAEFKLFSASNLKQTKQLARPRRAINYVRNAVVMIATSENAARVTKSTYVGGFIRR